MKFKCSVCNYESFRKDDVQKHINKKNKCGNGIPTITIISIDVKCNLCNKFFTTMPSMQRHMKICKANKTNLEIELMEKDKKIIELENKLAQNSTTNNNINTNIQNNYITIQLRPYTDPKLPEDIDDLNDIYEDAWDKKKSIHTFIERIHFNPDMPENHNMCITNLRTNLAKVFTGQGWETKDQNKLLDEIISRCSRELDKWVKSSKKRRDRYENDFIEYITQEGKKKFDDETKAEVKLLLYDSYKKGTVDIKTSSKQYQLPTEE